MKFLKLRKVITLLAVYVAISGFFYRESFASTSNPTTKAECEINDDRYCSFTCLGGGWKSIGTCSDDNNAKCCSREVSDVACNSTDCGNGVKGVCKPECDTGSEKQSGTCASSSSSSKCCVPASCTPTNTTPPTNTDSGTTPSGTASLNYTPLENLPGFEGQSGDFATYFGNLYKLALWIVAISALFMLVVGGFLYLSSAGNTSLLGTAKKTIYSALIGLVIALISWLLLDTINSDLTNLKLTGLTGAIGTSSGTSSSSTASPTSGSAAAVLSEAYKMVNNTSCNYSQAIPRNGCQGDPPHTDCSDFVVSAYKRAGCSVPPDGTSNMKAVAEDIGDKSSLKSGDAIVYNNGSHGHVVICENSGCGTYTAAASTKSGLVKGRDSAHVFSDGAAAGGLKVLRVSKYCKS